MPTRPVKCASCTKAWLAEYEENCEANLVCPECGAYSPNFYTALVLGSVIVNGKQVQMDFPTEMWCPNQVGPAEMVIECTSCSTKFKLDERLLKPSGSKVRCTKCGNIFRIFRDPESIGESGTEEKTHAASAKAGKESLWLDFEKRKYPRVRISLPVSCVLEDSEGNPMGLLMGHITEASQEGIVIELFNGPRTGMASLTFISHEDKEMSIRAKVVHAETGSIGKTKVGMSLMGGPKEITNFVTQAVRAHHSAKKVESPLPAGKWLDGILARLGRFCQMIIIEKN